MRPIGVAGGVTLSSPDNSYLSYFNSPYIGHSRLSSVDIYPSHEEWKGSAVSPCDGEVHVVQKVQMGRRRSFETDDFDYAIGIRSEQNPDVLARVMHCRPNLKEGDSVSAGDLLGNLIRSRYFNFWTGPHYHVEVLDKSDFRRSSQSYEISVPEAKLKFKLKPLSESIQCEVLRVSKDSLLCYSVGYSMVEYGSLNGQVAFDKEGKAFGLLDAGVPHYSHAGVLGSVVNSEAESIFAWGLKLGDRIQSRGNVTLFRTERPVKVSLDDISMRGLSLFAYSKAQLRHGVPPLLIIPWEQGTLSNYKEGDSVSLTFESE